MAAFDLQEQEQIASFKAWWQSWGKLLALAVFAASVTYLGNSAWHSWQTSRGQRASDAFVPVESAVKAHDLAKAQVEINKFITEWSSSALAPRGQLEVAKLAFDAGKLDDARKSLEWVVTNANEDVLVDAANIRLANVLSDQKQYDAALAAVKTPRDPSFDNLFAETRGDVLSIKGDNAAARNAYMSALTTMSKDAPARKLIEVKLAGLGS